MRCRARSQILNALYAQNALYQQVTSKVEGITHPYLNVGRIEGGTNTNVVPGKVVFKLDRRMIPEENPVEVEADDPQGDRRRGGAAARHHGRDQAPAAGQLAEAAAGQRSRWSTRIQKHGEAVFGEPIPAIGHAALHRRAPLRRGRHPGGDLRRRPAHGARVATPSAPTSTSCSKTCAARPRWSPARCATCSAARRSAARRSGRAWPRRARAGCSARRRDTPPSAARPPANSAQVSGSGIGDDRERVGDDAMRRRGRVDAVPVRVLVAVRADDGAAGVGDVGEAEQRRDSPRSACRGRRCRRS